MRRHRLVAVGVVVVEVGGLRMVMHVRVALRYVHVIVVVDVVEALDLLLMNVMVCGLIHKRRLVRWIWVDRRL